jgi:hypothetical protein
MTFLKFSGKAKKLAELTILICLLPCAGNLITPFAMYIERTMTVALQRAGQRQRVC